MTDSDPNWKQQLFIDLWRLIVAGAAILNAAAFFGLHYLIAGDPPPTYRGILLVLAAVLAGVLEVEFVGRRFLGVYHIQLHTRVGRLIAAGLALAFALAAFLAWHEHGQSQRRAENEQRADEERDQWRQKLNDPNVKEGMEAYQQLRARQQQQTTTRSATRPATRPATRATTRPAPGN